MNLKNNDVTLIGTIDEESVEVVNSVRDRKIYTFNMNVARMSEVADSIPVRLNSSILPDGSIDTLLGNTIKIMGEFQSKNRKIGEHGRLVLSIWAKEISLCEEGTESINDVKITGTLCKPPVYRETPLGRRITDGLLAVNGDHGKSYYIPCIFWGSKAKYVSNFEVGDVVEVRGRVQSRKYNKKISETKFEERMAYELSCNTVKKLGKITEL